MKTLHVFLNYSCNARCPFCFNPAEPSELEWKGRETSVVAANLLKARDAGCVAANFIGGEATVRADLPALAAAARRLGYREVRLVTNGIRLADPEYAASLVRAGISRFEFSIHSHRPELHDRMLGVPGALGKALRGLREVRALGARVAVNMVVTAWNHRGLADAVEALHRDHGVSEFSLFGLRYIGHAGLEKNAEALRVPMAEAAPSVAAALDRLDGLGLIDGVFVSDFPPCLLPGRVDRLSDWREGANQDMLVSPDGTLTESEPVCAQDRMRVAACGDCSYGDRCLGVESSYVKRFGEAEFRPVPAAVAA